MLRMPSAAVYLTGAPCGKLVGREDALYPSGLLQIPFYHASQHKHIKSVPSLSSYPQSFLARDILAPMSPDPRIIPGIKAAAQSACTIVCGRELT